MSWHAHGGWAQEEKASGGGSGDLLWHAVEEGVKAIMPMEQELDENKLNKKIRDYFNKAAKNLNYRTKNLWELVDEYADNVFSSLFCGLGDREWLSTGQADFILVLDAGIKDNFPKHVISKTPQTEFERMVLAAHDRAFEEQRFAPLLQEAVTAAVQGPKTRRKVWNAVELGRKEAISSAVTPEDFTACWISRTIGSISENAQGDPESVITADAACQLFHSLIEGGALPLAMTQAAGPPPRGWPLVEEAVQTAYITHAAFDDGAAASGGSREAPAAKRRKGAGKAAYSAFFK